MWPILVPFLVIALTINSNGLSFISILENESRLGLIIGADIKKLQKWAKLPPEMTPDLQL